MFTGIIKGLCPIQSIQETAAGLRFQINLHPWAQDLQLGASVAINGVCLTVVEVEQDVASFDVIPETLRCSNLGKLQQGNLVNIERACKVGDEIGGHQVSGHVDTVGHIDHILQEAQRYEVTIRFEQQWSEYLIPKGWIAIDGASLTVVSHTTNTLTVALIPETIRMTTFGFKQVGDSVNLEFDSMAKMVSKYVQHWGEVGVRNQKSVVREIRTRILPSET